MGSGSSKPEAADTLVSVYEKNIFFFFFLSFFFFGGGGGGGGLYSLMINKKFCGDFPSPM